MAPRRSFANRVLRGGSVRTLDDGEPHATAVAIAGDRIVAVGTDHEIAGWIDDATDVIDLAGATVIPGINDAHLHLALFAQTRLPAQVDLSQARSLTDIRASITDALGAGTELACLVGNRWHERRIAEFTAGGHLPHRRHLDIDGNSTPVVLHHDSLHAVWVNTAALEAAGIDSTTPDPVGGRIARDDHDEPTGLLLESAGALVSSLIPEIARDTRLDAIADAMAHLNSMGVTSITDPVVWPQLLRDYVELRRQGRATIRISALLHWDWPSTSSSDAKLARALEYAGFSSGLGDWWVRVGGIKLFADGVPGSRTACVHHPYPDGTCGDLVVAGSDFDARRQELTAMVRRAHRHRLNVQIHVTGDSAADVAIDAIAAAQLQDPWPDARHALIHGTLLSAQAPQRMREHNIAIVVQSLLKYHSGAGMVPSIGRQRWDDAFPVRRLLDAGVLVADSSDAPCVIPDWRLGMLTFVGGADHELGRLDRTRRLTPREALAAWTTAGAHLEHAEADKGTISVGKLADLAVLDTDPLTAPAADIGATTVLWTIVGGEVTHCAATSTKESSVL